MIHEVGSGDIDRADRPSLPVEHHGGDGADPWPEDVVSEGETAISAVIQMKQVCAPGAPHTAASELSEPQMQMKCQGKTEL